MAKADAYLGRVQVLRFFAAVAVLFAHLQHEALMQFPAAHFRAFTWIDGGFGVDLFFVISGFIMYHVSADKFGRPDAAREFLVRRFVRIAPLYYLATLLMLAAGMSFARRSVVCDLRHPSVEVRGGALIWRRLGVSASPWLYIAVLLCGVIAAAVVINRLGERPLDRRLRRMLESRRQSPVSAPVAQA